MALDLTMDSLTVFVTVTVLLVIFSVFDIRTRAVSNEILFSGFGIGGFVMMTFTLHLENNVVLHLTALLFVFPIAYSLFRIGSIGGADFKALAIVAFFSPGIELGFWNQPILEAIIGLGGELIVMLLGGYLYWRYKEKQVTPPLIPLLLLGYLVLQLLAFF